MTKSSRLFILFYKTAVQYIESVVSTDEQENNTPIVIYRINERRNMIKEMTNKENGQMIRAILSYLHADYDCIESFCKVTTRNP